MPFVPGWYPKKIRNNEKRSDVKEGTSKVILSSIPPLPECPASNHYIWYSELLARVGHCQNKIQ